MDCFVALRAPRNDELRKPCHCGGKKCNDKAYTSLRGAGSVMTRLTRHCEAEGRSNPSCLLNLKSQEEGRIQNGVIISDSVLMIRKGKGLIISALNIQIKAASNA